MPVSARISASSAEDLVLDRDVQGRRRLIRQQHARVGGDRQRDHHALAHPARQLVRVLPEARFADDAMPTRSSSSTARRSGGAGVASARASRSVSTIWSPTREHRVEAGARVLEDHRDLAAAHRAQLARTAGPAARGRASRMEPAMTSPG